MSLFFKGLGGSTLLNTSLLDSGTFCHLPRNAASTILDAFSLLSAPIVRHNLINLDLNCVDTSLVIISNIWIYVTERTFPIFSLLIQNVRGFAAAGFFTAILEEEAAAGFFTAIPEEEAAAGFFSAILEEEAAAAAARLGLLLHLAPVLHLRLK